MKKAIKYIFIIAAIMLLAITVNANEQYTITYDFGVAVIRSELIENDNPLSYTKGQAVELIAPSCPGFEFRGWFTDDGHNDEITAISAEAEGDITLYAKWYEMTYNISYVLTDGVSGLSPEDITNDNRTTRKASEDTYLYAPMCNTPDYTFAGWYEDLAYTRRVDSIEAYTCEDVTLYAKWVPTEYPVHYDMGDAEKSSFKTDNFNPDFYVYGQELILTPPETEDPALTFEGWYSDSGFTDKITSIPAGTNGSVVVYAKWNIKEYRIIYVLADNSGISADSVINTNADYRSTLEDYILSAPVSEDKSFSFDGWYTSPTFESNTYISKIKASTDHDIVLYAKWKTAVYKISYTYAMISPSYLRVENPNPTEYHYGDSTELLPVEAEGFIFNGWCTDSTLKNKITAIPADSYGDITLHADFTEKTYSITYILGGNGVDPSQVVNRNHVTVRTTTEQISLLEAQTLNTEYEFDGWYLDPEYTEEIEYIRAYTTGNITLYAKWVKKIIYVPVWGDATLSDMLSAADARLILRYSAGLETGFSDLQLKVSDINNDDKVNAADARLVLRLAAAIEKEEDLMEKYNLPTIEVVEGEIVFK